jgi:Nif-specific regulatory protein
MVHSVRPPIQGRYRVLHELSSSPESRVFLAEDLRHTGRLCALKVFRLSSPESFEAAEKEFEVLRKLRHPGIAEVYDLGRLSAAEVESAGIAIPAADALEDYGRAGPPDGSAASESFAYIGSAYYAGLNLRHAFLSLFPQEAAVQGASGPEEEKTVDRRWKIFLEALARICEALDEVHSRGLIHYDIKPENILLIPHPAEGPPSRFDVKILDFGLSEEETTPVGRRIRGTIPFLAPELLENATADKRSDLYSLGVTFALAMTGRFPFPGLDPQDWLAASRAGNLENLRDLRPDMPAGLPELLEHLLNRDPAKRPLQARSVFLALAEVGGLRLSPNGPHADKAFPLVGWEREITLVRSEIQELKRGEAEKALIAFEGDSGQFLHRLLDEIVSAARAEGVWVVSGRARLPRKYSHQPFAEIVSKLCVEIDFSHPRFLRLRDMLSVFAPGSVPSPPGARVLLPLKPRLEVFRFLDLATEFFLELAREKPLVLCIQDMHLAGRESLDLLKSLARNIALRSRRGEASQGEPSDPARVLIVGTLRDLEDERELEGEVGANLPILSEILSEPYAARVRLRNLGLDTLPEWIRERAPRLRFPGDLLRRLHDKSGGSMWFLDEFLRTVLRDTPGDHEGEEAPVPGGEAPGDSSPARDPKLFFRFPRKAEDSALERFASLPEADRQLLEVLSASQGPLSVLELEAAASSGEAEGGAPSGALSRLIRLESLGFIDLREGKAGTEAAIAQPKLAEQIYLQLKEETRPLLHRKIATVLLETARADQEPCRVLEDVAFHARLAGWDELFLGEAIRAAEKLTSCHAPDAAAQLYEEVLDRVGSARPPALPDADSVRRIINEELASIYLGKGQLQKAIEKLTLLSTAHEMLTDRIHLASLYRRMGEAYQQAGELANALHFLEKSLKLLREPAAGDEAQREAEVTEEILLTLLALARYYLSREDLKEAERISVQCLEHSGSAPSHLEARSRAQMLLGEVESRRSQPGQSLALNLRALELAKQGENLPLLVEVLSSVGWSYVQGGEYDKAIERFQEALGVARTLGSKYDTAACYSSLGTIYHNRADHQRALEYFTLSLRLSSEIGDLKGIANSYNNLGIVHRLKDNLTLTSECYKRAIDLFSRINDQNGMAAGMNNLSSILELEGKYNEALDYAFRALDKRKKSRSQSGMAFSYYRIGKIYQSKGELDKAVTYAEKSIQIRKELGEKMGIAYSSLQLSELYLLQGKHLDSFQLCEEGLKTFESLENEVGALMARETQARLFLYFGELVGARRILEDVLKQSRKREQHMLATSSLFQLARVAREMGDFFESERRLLEAENLFRSNQNKRELAEVLLEECALKLEMGLNLTANEPLEEAYSILEELGVRDLVPLYFLLRGRLEMEARQGDFETARKFLERGLVEAREVNLADVRWRFHHLIAILEGRRGDLKLARLHLQESEELLGEAYESVPEGCRGSFYLLRERDELRKTLSTALPSFPPARPQEKELSGDSRAPGSPPGDGALDGILPPRSPEACPPQSTEGGASAQEELLALHREALKLHEIAAAMGTERNLQRLLESIMDAVLELVDAERGFLILKGGGNDERTITVARNLQQQQIPESEAKVSESISTGVLRTGRPVLARNALGDRRFFTSKSVRHLRLKSLVCVPLRFRNEVLGAIYLDNRSRPAAFHKADLSILQAFADQAAVAVTNARLIEEDRKRTVELMEAKEKTEWQNLKLRRTVHRRTAQLALAWEDLRDRQSQLEDRYRFQNIVGKSEAMQEIFFLLERISKTQLPVLLEGESGTGKELIARAIHFNSAQKEGRFVSENCGALTETLLETELFGHDKGAFTGAISDKKGLFELADHGTLFLDEVGDMSLGMQQKLLRVLEEGEIRRVGGKENIRVQVRIVSASNKDLELLVKAGRFREDLYYRLNGIRIHVPSLRDRKEDIPLLVEHFVEKMAVKSSEPPRAFQPEAIGALMAYDWPGNVRELRHLVERTLLIVPGTAIQEEDLLFDAPKLKSGEDGPRLGQEKAREAATTNREETWLGHLGEARSVKGFSLREARDSFERSFLSHSLEEAEGNVARAARACGVSRESLYRLLKKHGLKRKEDFPLDE